MSHLPETSQGKGKKPLIHNNNSDNQSCIFFLSCTREVCVIEKMRNKLLWLCKWLKCSSWLVYVIRSSMHLSPINMLIYLLGTVRNSLSVAGMFKCFNCTVVSISLQLCWTLQPICLIWITDWMLPTILLELAFWWLCKELASFPL